MNILLFYIGENYRNIDAYTRTVLY